MKAKRKGKFQPLSALLGALCALATTTPLWADDTEIYFGGVVQNAATRPNVLLVLDTSSSMTQTVEGTGMNRLDNMKVALQTILDNASNINVGLMRFHRQGGPVLYPVSYIDEDVCNIENCDDGSTTVARVGAGPDDAEQTSAGVVTLDSDTLELISAGGTAPEPQTVGLRFQHVQIPQGVTITSALLEFEAAAADSVATGLEIRGVNSDDAAAFTTAANDLTLRPTTAAVAWNSVENWDTVNGKYQSPDISSAVQAIVDRAGWCGGNSMAFLLSGSGLRRALSYDSAPDSAPTLRLSYDADSVPSGGGCVNQTLVKAVADGSDDAEEDLATGAVSTGSSDLDLISDGSDEQLIGVRFQDLGIPQGATVLSAVIDFEIDEDDGNNSSAIGLRIYGEASDSADGFTGNANDISNRSRTSTSVAWDSLPAPIANETLSTPDLAAVVQEIVDRSGWSSGNDLAFVIEKSAGSGRRVVESRDGEPVAAPTLRVQVQWNAGGGGGALLTVRQRLKQIVDELEYKSGTPIVDTMYEAARYYRGMDVFYGRSRGYGESIGDGEDPGSRSQYTRVSHPASYTGGRVLRDALCSDDNLNAEACIDEYISSVDGTPTYISPITSECQANYMVLLTDGEPSVNTSVSLVQSLPDFDGSCATPAIGSSGTCAIEMADYLYGRDHNAELADTQKVVTHTIGFNFSDPWLGQVAAAGGGSSFVADTAAQLTEVFESIIGEVLEADSTFVAPGVAVNQFNRLTHRDDIYFSLFRPNAGSYWSGNLKRYRIAGTPPVIVDSNGDPAVDGNTGFFRNGAQSFWSSAADGNDTARGGVAENLDANGRRVYTNAGGGAGGITGAGNALHEDNVALTKSLLGIENRDDAYRTALLQWARGVDLRDFNENGTTAETRRQIGDPLHSRPVSVTYGGSDDAPDMTIFFGTNEGYLHAIDPDDGSEVFAFMPWELLGQLNALYANTPGDRPYGVDGEIAVDVLDLDGDGQIETGVSEDLDGDGLISAFEKEHVYLYFGLRRGGRSYYALDVTDRSSPRLMWTVNGGMSDFAELGQSWSKPKKAKINVDGSVRDVLIFGGGYDPDQDQHSVRTPDDEGRALYVVDAGTGELLWAAGGSGSDVPLARKKTFTAMEYSIPSEVRVLDINSDGLADQMYVGDMGGQLWRFDIRNGQSAADLVDGTVIAALGAADNANDNAKAVDNRRFYNAPSAAVVAEDDGYRLTLTIGSGWRAHPLDVTVEDRFYVLRGLPLGRPADADNDGAADYGAALTEAELYDATENRVQDGNDSAAVLDQIDQQSGWYIRLEHDGEKALAESTIVNHQVMFTSYTPAPAETASCQPSVGTGRFYLLDLKNGSATLNLDGSPDGSDVTDGDNDGVADNLDKADRSLVLKNTGIPPEVVIYLSGDPAESVADADNIAGLVGTETVDVDFGDVLRRTYWREDTTID